MGFGSPRSQVLCRRSESLFPFSVPILFGRPRYRRSEYVSVNSPVARQAMSIKLLPYEARLLQSAGGAALPTSRGDPVQACYDSWTPVDLEVLAMSHFLVLPSAGIKTSAPHYLLFEAQSRACVACCLRFAVRSPFLRKTR